MIEIQCWPLVVVFAAGLVNLFLTFRVSAFRVDRPYRDRYFGMPLMGNWKYLNPDNFRPEGRRFLWLLWGTNVVLIIAALLLLKCA